MDPYGCPRGKPCFDLTLDGERNGWRHHSVRFPAAFPTRHQKNHLAHGEYFQPRHAPNAAPLVILLHGVGDHSVIPCRLLARHLAGTGIACFVLYLVMHSSRMPPDVRRRMPLLTDDEWFEGYQTSVVEVRQVVDWAAVRPEIDASRVGLLGISFGGFVSSIAMAVDERVGGGVFVVTGGNSARIAQESRLAAIRRRYRMPAAEYRESLRAYQRYLADVHAGNAGSVVPPRKSYLNDPVTFAHKLRDRSVLMLNARWDEFIPREATLDLWRACGEPPIVWYPSSHATIWLWYRSICGRAEAFFGSVFGLAGPALSRRTSA